MEDFYRDVGRPTSSRLRKKESMQDEMVETDVGRDLHLWPEGGKSAARRRERSTNGIGT